MTSGVASKEMKSKIQNLKSKPEQVAL